MSEIRARRASPLSAWVSIEEVEVRPRGQSQRETYHGLRQSNAVTILALHQEGSIPLVRQFRPIVGAWTWELPSGLIDPGEAADEAAKRELLEETGFESLSLVALSRNFENTARLTSQTHTYFALVGGTPMPHEAGLEIKMATPDRVRAMAGEGALSPLSHVAVLYLAAMDARVDAICRACGFEGAPWV